ncbi:MAG: hypothetical protein ACLQB1_11460 [Streptosporangiaceae bacterium]
MKPTQKRIDRAVRHMKRLLASEDAARFRQIGIDAQILYVIGILICDNIGFIPRDKLNLAANDGDVRYAAMIVAGRVGLLGPRASIDHYA